jgi:glycosyltransferase involved in cell wall biosynthesis
MYISVVICTYNRADLLIIAIDSLLKQSLDADEFEILIIDNNSKDTTQQVGLTYAKNHKNVTYFLEEKVGLSHARNRGYLEAKGNYVAYADDDCNLPVDWLLNAKNVILDKDYAVLGGPVYPFYLYEKPTWYKDNYELLTFGDEAKVLEEGEYLFGGNIFFRKDILKEFNGFNPEFGMTGNTIGYAEETELQIRIRATYTKESIYYDPQLSVKHLVRFEKTTLAWLIKSFYARGKHNFFLRRRSNELPNYANKHIVLPKLLSVYAKISIYMIFGMLFRSRKTYPNFKNFLYERIQGHIKKLGFLKTYYKYT